MRRRPLRGGRTFRPERPPRNMARPLKVKPAGVETTAVDFIVSEPNDGGKTRKLCPVYVFKMSEELGAIFRGKPYASLILLRLFRPGERLFLREFNGAATGRADLCMVMRTDPSPRDGGYLTSLSRRWCWGQGKHDDDLTDLSLKVLPDEFPILTVADLPPADPSAANDPKENQP